ESTPSASAQSPLIFGKQRNIDHSPGDIARAYKEAGDGSGEMANDKAVDHPLLNRPMRDVIGGRKHHQGDREAEPQQSEHRQRSRRSIEEGCLEDDFQEAK